MLSEIRGTEQEVPQDLARVCKLIKLISQKMRVELWLPEAKERRSRGGMGKH